MDEHAYHATRKEINQLPCVFEKALLARCVVCGLAVKQLLAEREMMACTDPLARASCAQLSALLREKSAFALKITDTVRILPHAQTMKIQCGGLGGLRDVIDPGAPGPDVHRLVRKALEQFATLEALPYSAIVQGVAQFQVRKRFHPKAET
jgi:hypothetical protein